MKEALPELKEYPVIKILDPTHLDSTGVTLNAEFVNQGSEKTVAFGFTWDIKSPDIRFSDTVIITYNSKIRKYSIRLNTGLVKDYLYYIRAFAITENHTVYSEVINIESKGSQHCPWQRVTTFSLTNFAFTYGISTSNSGYILFSHGAFFEYDVSRNIVLRLPDYPGVMGIVVPVQIDNEVYLICSKNVYLWNYSNGAWHKLGINPFGKSTGIIGFSLNRKGYFCQGSHLYEYNKETAEWVQKNQMPSTKVYSAVVINNLAYVVGDSNKVFKYDPSVDNWFYVTEYPGILDGQLLCFNLSEKAYFGINCKSGLVIDRTIWEYDPKKNSWKRLIKFPITELGYNVSCFKVNGKAFFGLPCAWPSDSFQLLEFNPDKLL